jgi:tetratricopeptide (TPR) repeat protein
VLPPNPGGARPQRSWAAIIALATVGCGPPAPPADLARAEKLRQRGDDAAALVAYDAATATCAKLRDRGRRARFCGLAFSGRADVLERLGRPDEAAQAYEDCAAAIPDADATAAGCLHAAAMLRLRLGQDARAYDLFWKVIVAFPDETAAEDALRVVVRDGRRRAPAQLDDVLGRLYERLAESELADNLLFARADVREHELGDPRGALDLADRLVERYPTAALADDALWVGANLARRLDDPKGALRRLEALLATRETAYLVGSYHSIWLDDAQLLAAVIWRDDLGEPKRALALLGDLPRHYPDSILRDDAVWEAALTRAALADRPGACRDLGTLAAKYPDSKHLLEDAPAKARVLGCPGATDEPVAPARSSEAPR